MSGKVYSLDLLLTATIGSQYTAAFKQAQSQITSMQNELQGLKRSQNDISAYQKQQKALEDSREKLENLQQQYDLLQREIEETEGPTTSLEREKLKLQQRITGTAAVVETHERKVSELGEALRSADIDTENLTEESKRLAEEYESVKTKQQGVIDKFSEGGDKARFFGDETVNAVEAIQETMVAAGITKLIKEIGEAMVECGKESIEFESAITGVYKTVDGSEQQLAAIKSEIKDLATEIPATTEEIAAVAESAGQLGIATENVMTFTGVMIDLGESTNLAAEEAASSLAKFTNITGTVATEYSRLGSVIVDLGNNFATTEADIVAMATRLAASGTLAGLTEPEIMALATAMSSVGIEAEAGGTAMTQTLTAIEKAVAQGEDALDEYARIAGMSAQEFATAWETTPIHAIQAFIAGVGKLEDQGESAVLVLEDLGLTGIRQSNMLKSLGLAADTLSGAVNLANTAWDENVALSIEAGKRYATTESQLAMLENSFGNMKVAVGDVFTPALKDAVEVGIDVTKGLTEFIEKNPAVVKTVAALTAGVAATALSISGYIVVSKAARIATTALTGAMNANPFLLAATALVGVTTAVVALTAGTDDATESWRDLAEANEEATAEYKASVAAIEDEAAATQLLLTQLDELSAKESKTAADKAQILELCKQLNAAIPDLALSYDAQTDSLSGLTEGLDEYIEAQANAQAMEQKVARMVELKTTMNETEIAIAEAKAALAEYQEEYAEIIESGSGGFGMAREMNSYVDVIAELSEQLESQQAEYDELYESVNEYNAAQEESVDTMADTSEAVAVVQAEINALQEAYNEAYQSALESYQGQYSLWSEAGEIVETTTSDLIGALESQQSYWTSYADNVDTVRQRIAELAAQGYDTAALEAYVNAANDGSEEAAGVFAAMASASDTNLLAIGENYAELETAQESAATSTAELATNYSTKLAEMEARMQQFVDNMNQDTEAAFAANQTMSSYHNGLLAYGPTLYSDGYYLGSSFMSGLRTSTSGALSISVSGGYPIGGFAVGTLNAPPGWAWVGEEGPELMHFSGGETVLPADLSAEVATAYNAYSGVSNAVATASQATVAEPLMAKDSGGGSGSQIVVTVSPVYHITGGGDARDIENVLAHNTEALKEYVLDVVNEAVADGERLAYK